MKPKEKRFVGDRRALPFSYDTSWIEGRESGEKEAKERRKKEEQEEEEEEVEGLR